MIVCFIMWISVESLDRFSLIECRYRSWYLIMTCLAALDSVSPVKSRTWSTSKALVSVKIFNTCYVFKAWWWTTRWSACFKEKSTLVYSMFSQSSDNIVTTVLTHQSLWKYYSTVKGSFPRFLFGGKPNIHNLWQKKRFVKNIMWLIFSVDLSIVGPGYQTELNLGEFRLIPLKGSVCGSRTHR